MPREFLGDVTRPPAPIGDRRWSTVTVSLVSHAAVVLLLVLVPLMAPAVLPVIGRNTIAAFAVSMPPPPPPPPPPAIRRDAPPPVNRDAAPVEAPSAITPEPDVLDAGFEAETGVDGGLGSLVPGGVDSGLPPAPPPAAPPARSAPVRVGGAIQPPTKIRDVSPIYPAIAQAARVQGLVILEATIAADGRVSDARVLRSVPLLDQAALDAVRQWRFTPTRLNGEPVPVVMTVTVNFQLQ
ncbi:MAG: energy transducer TonB [Vicinamibacterales bacterium]